MKRLMYGVVIIALPLIVFFQYDQYVRHHPPATTFEEIAEGIDTDYHDPSVVLKYYESAEAVNTYARFLWKEHKIDVRNTSPGDGASADKMQRYHQYVATTRYLKEKLERSAEHKAAGLSNDDIRYMEQHQVGPEEMAVRKFLKGKSQLQFGDTGQTVMDMQKLLEAKGFPLRIDGIFDQETQQTITNFQTANQLFPSGVADDATLRILLSK